VSILSRSSYEDETERGGGIDGTEGVLDLVESEPLDEPFLVDAEAPKNPHADRDGICVVLDDPLEELAPLLFTDALRGFWGFLLSSRSLRWRCCATVSLAGSDHDTSNIVAGWEVDMIPGS
jgi:hypothetical protein